MRWNIIEAIEAIGDKEVVPRLVEMLNDVRIHEDMYGKSYESVYDRMGEVIGSLGDEEVVVKMLGDERIDRDLRFV